MRNAGLRSRALMTARGSRPRALRVVNAGAGLQKRTADARVLTLPELQHLNELHGRIVLDFLNQLWKVQWPGVGASYIWGTNISGCGHDELLRQ